MALDAGEFTIVLEYAQGLKDMDLFGKQDPYCILTCGAQTYRSKTHTDGGKNPVWNQTFKFNIFNENDLSISIFDEDTVGKDDLIGTARVPFTKARTLGKDQLQLPVACKKNKQKGFVQVSVTFTKNSSAHQAPQPAHQAPQPAYAQAHAAHAPPPVGQWQQAPPPGGYPPHQPYQQPYGAPQHPGHGAPPQQPGYYGAPQYVHQQPGYGAPQHVHQQPGYGAPQQPHYGAPQHHMGY